MGRRPVPPRPSVLAALSDACGGLVTDRLLVAVTRCGSARSLTVQVHRLRRLGFDVRRDNAGRGYYLREPRA